jgi:hypothetical protein
MVKDEAKIRRFGYDLVISRFLVVLLLDGKRFIHSSPQNNESSRFVAPFFRWVALLF